MLPAQNLDVDVFHRVTMKAGDGARIADPKIDGIRGLLERYTCEWDILLSIMVQRDVLVAEIVVL